MTITYEYRHLGKPNPVHRATEPATAPIGQASAEIAVATHHCVDSDCPHLGQPTNSSCGCHQTREQMLWLRIRKVEHDNNQAAATIYALREEVKAAYDQIKKLEAALDECIDYFEDRADADCDQDGYIPNDEMKMLSNINEALHGPGAF